MVEFVSWAVGIATTLAILLFLFKLVFDRRAAPRGVEGALAAPGRSGWLAVVGFFVGLLSFPIGAALSLNIGPFELYRFWEPGLLAGDEPRWFALCLFGTAFGTVALFFFAHMPKHRRHLPWHGGSSL